MKKFYVLLSVLWMVQFVSASEASQSGNASSDERHKICLNGEWDFRALDVTSDKIPNGGWDKMRVPGSYGISGFTNFDLPREILKSPGAWYRRSFDIPAAWNDGRRIKLKFLHLHWANKVFVNGKLVSKAEVARTCFEDDITDLVKFGQKNEVVVWVSQLPAKKRASLDAGILRSVYLVTVPATHIRYAHVITSVRKKSITVRYQITNDGQKDSSVLIGANVKDNGKNVLTFSARQVKVPAGKTVTVNLQSPWKNPVLWGFGKYGKPHLYHLESTLTSEAGRDVKWDRFGFREFYSVGRHFYLNGKNIVLHGDLITRTPIFVESPDYVTAFYLGMRRANCNFQRMHSFRSGNFDSQYWYEVADELGHLVQAQFYRMRGSEKVYEPDSPESKAIWEAYVNEHFNHPSLIMWSVDNELFTERGKYPPIKEYTRIQPETVKPQDRIISFVRSIDPTRIVEMHHGYATYLGIDKGWMKRENYMTFNIHPYGSIGKWTAAELKNTKFDYSVPVVIGEIYDFCRQIDLLKHPQGAYREQWRRGFLMSRGVRQVNKLRAAGMVLCGLVDNYCGYRTENELYLGPWSDHVLIRDESKPGKPVVGERKCNVKIRWPSLSGEGVKAKQMLTHKEGGGSQGHNRNWFDSTRPAFYPNAAAEMIRETYKSVAGKHMEPLGPERAFEVVVYFGVDGKPGKSAYVHLQPMDGQARPGSVATDANGTAWFRLWDTGRYLVTTEFLGKKYQSELIVRKRPELDGKAGYNHIQWVKLGNVSLPAYVADLSEGAEFTDGPIRMVDEVLINGDVEFWIEGETTAPHYWMRSAVKDEKIVKSGRYSAKLVGNQTQLPYAITLDAGKRYRVSGWIRKQSGKSVGQIGIRSGSWKWLLKLQGSKTVGKWEYVEGDYVATGAERYFFCANWYMGKDGVANYDKLSIKEIGQVEQAEDKKKSKTITSSFHHEGPYTPDGSGFLRNWLACGPMPNLFNEDGDPDGLHKDFLTAFGGEAAATPKHGQKVEVDFPKAAFWKDGKITVPWRALFSRSSRVKLDSLICEEIGIAARPPSFVCGYLACTVVSQSDRDVLLAIGSDDGYKAWLNGKLVATVEKARGAQPDQETYQVRLRKGDNRLMLKVYQEIGGWNAFVRFLDSEKKPIQDLQVFLEAGDSDSVLCMTPEGGVQPAFVGDRSILYYVFTKEDGDVVLRAADLSSGTWKEVPDTNGVSRPVVSPADGRIAFEKDGKIVVMDADGKQKVVSLPGETCSSPSWTDFGRRLAFAGRQGKNVRVMSIDPDNPRDSLKIYENLREGEPVFSPSGKYVAMVTADSHGTSMIKLMKADGTSIADLVSKESGKGGITVRGCYDPVFSSDEKTVVFVRSSLQPSADLFAYSLDTGKERRLTIDQADNQSPAFSPDGRWLFFAAARDGGEHKVYRMKVAKTPVSSK